MALTKKNVVAIPYKVQYLLLTDVQSFLIYNLNFVNIILAAGKAWRDFYSTSGSIEFSEKGNKTADGYSYAAELKQFYPGIDADSIAIINKREHQKLIIRVLFNDGSNRIIGTIQSPARIVTDTDSTSKKSGITIVTTKRSTNSSLFYDPDYIS